MFFILTVPVLVTIGGLQYQKVEVRREIKKRMLRGLDKSELVLLAFTQAENRSLLQWEHNREFEYQHQMYDVIDTEIRGDSIFYWCWWDHEETKLNRQLRELLTHALNHDPLKKEAQHKLYSFFLSLYHPEGFLSLFFPSESGGSLCFQNVFFLTTLKFPPPTPPPWVNKTMAFFL